MRLRAQSRHRWQDCQLCEGKRCSHQGTRFRRRRVSGNTSTKCIITGTSTKIRILLSLLLFNYVLTTMTITVDGFGFGLGFGLIEPKCERRFCERGIYGHIQSGRSTQLQNTDDNYAEMDDSEGDEDNESELEVENIYSELEIDQNDDLPSPIEDLSWRVEKLRLEEANTRRFLKAGPRFLPYEECRKWVQAWDRWDCEDDWVRWIDEGEKRNSYIPARPDEYYGKLGKWKGWDHFLGKDRTDDFQ